MDGRRPEGGTIVLFYPRTLHESNYRNFHVPYSLLTVASVVDRAKYKVLVIDNNADTQDNFDTVLGSIGQGILCVGISSMIGHQIRDGLRFARAVRKLDASIPIIWGGTLPTLLAEETIQDSNVDILVRGQGQETFRILVDSLSAGRDLGSIQGISYKFGGRPVHNPPRPFLDVNSFPAFSSVYDLIDPAKYVRCDEHINSRTLSYHASQGCPFNCGFCSEVALWHNHWSGLRAERILEDVTFLVEHFGINGVKFYDAEFFINRKRVMDWAKGLLAWGLAIHWAAAVHPKNLNRLSDEEWSLLHKSGAVRLLIGAESGIAEELDLVGKGTDREMLLQLARRCSEHEIFASFTFVTGYPGMRSENILETLQFAAELRQIDSRHEAKVHFYAPFPGTPLYELSQKHGFVPPQTLDEWSRYDYYNITTPWVKQSYQTIVREFNEANCPYVPSLSDLRLKDQSSVV